MISQKCRTAVVLFLLATVSACSAHPKRVDCEARLQPINHPAPAQKTSEVAP